MGVVTKERLLELAKAHAGSLPSVKQWLSTVQNASWSHLADIRNTFNSADMVHLNSGSTVYVFNIRSYRLITAIHFTPKNPNRGRVYVREFLTHAEYGKNTWKERNWIMTTLIERNTTLPASYNGLVAAFMPRPIHDKVSHDNTLAVIDALAGRSLNEEQEDYLDLLSTLVEVYEDDMLKDELASLPRGLSMVRYLCEENGVNGVELGRILGVGRAQVSLLLKGERGLTVAHLQKLAGHFKVSSELFMERMS